jgi:hypothetical protein
LGRNGMFLGETVTIGGLVIQAPFLFVTPTHKHMRAEKTSEKYTLKHAIKRARDSTSPSKNLFFKNLLAFCSSLFP